MGEMKEEIGSGKGKRVDTVRGLKVQPLKPSPFIRSNITGRLQCMKFFYSLESPTIALVLPYCDMPVVFIMHLNIFCC